MHLQIDKLVDWVFSCELGLSDFDLAEGVCAVEVLPELADWAKLLSPFFFVETDFLGGGSSETF